MTHIHLSILAGVALLAPALSLRAEQPPRKPAAAPVAALAYHPDGKLLAAGSREEIVFVDPSTGDVAGKLAGQTARVTALAFSRDGRRLAAASGTAGSSGEVRLYTVPSNGMPGPKPQHVLKAHHDLIYDLAFSPDGQTLATCGYDRLIKLWDADTGKEQRTLKDHSDTVYGLAFSPDGKLLASAAADRAVKVWEVATGKRLYTLADATDWVYAVAWSPDGRHLAAAGVDKSIRVWEVNAEGGKLIHSVFAHEGPVTRLAYAADNKTLYSLGEDQSVKAWDAARMTERRVYPKQPETTLAFAVRPDHKQVALGRYDGVLALLDEATGKVQSEPLPAKPKAPQLTKLSPRSGRRGQVVRVTFEGKDFGPTIEVVVNHPGVTAKVLPDAGAANTVQAEITFPGTTPAGVYQINLKNAVGPGNSLAFTVDAFAPQAEKEANNSPSSGQEVTLPTSVAGALGQAGDVDYFRFEARAGQEVGVHAVIPATKAPFQPVLQLFDAAGTLLAESANGVLGYACPAAGTFALGIRDREYRGGGDMSYRLHIGDLPVVTAVFPLGLQRGTEVEIALDGVNLGGTGTDRVKAPAGASPGTRLLMSVNTPGGEALGNPHVVVGEFPEVTARSDRPVSLAAPATANGRIDRPGATEVWGFHARKSQPLIVEVDARRLGSPLDSFIEILDGKGQLLERAVLRCVAKTYTTFRDHDSVSPGIRIEAWNELAINDYLYVGGELIRIQALPKNPDDDCRFFSVNNQRAGYLGTTPTHQSNGTPMYKVTIHPPGSVFPPNGLPVFPIPYRNDDGGTGYGKDSVLFFDPPVDGEYQVRVGDSRGQGGRAFVYRLTVRPPRPSFEVKFNPTAPAVWKGGALPINVTADRSDGFDDAIDLRLENLPPGFSAPATTIPAGENSTTFALYAEPGAAVPANASPLKLVASATIGGKKVVREAAGGVPKVVDPGDIVTTAEQSEVTVRPGGEVRLTVTIERRNGFTGRVPLDVRGLPHGVRVLDIGLNGILITEKETTRTFVIYAEPWVEPTEHPIVVLARREGKNTEHAAKSVMLKVAK